MKTKVDKKKIKDLAKELIKQGKTKQDVYDELVKTFKYRKIVADIVRYIPSNGRLKRFSIWNTLFLVLISVMTVLSLLQPTLGIIWLVFLIVIVAMKKFKYYYWNTILGVITIISILGLIFYQDLNNDFETTLIMLLFSIPIALIFIFAGIYLPKIMTPKYSEIKEEYLDKNGNKRFRMRYIFNEEQLLTTNV